MTPASKISGLTGISFLRYSPTLQSSALRGLLKVCSSCNQTNRNVSRFPTPAPEVGPLLGQAVLQTASQEKSCQGLLDGTPFFQKALQIFQILLHVRKTKMPILYRRTDLSAELLNLYETSIAAPKQVRDQVSTSSTLGQENLWKICNADDSLHTTILLREL